MEDHPRAEPRSGAPDNLSRRAALRRVGAGGLATVLLARGLASATAQDATSGATPGATGDYMAVRTYDLVPGSSVDELIGIIESGYVPIVTQVPGFVEYFILIEGSERLVAVNVFDDTAGADETSRLAADFVAQNLARFFQGPPVAVVGEVRIHHEAP